MSDPILERYKKIKAQKREEEIRKEKQRRQRIEKQKGEAIEAFKRNFKDILPDLEEAGISWETVHVEEEDYFKSIPTVNVGIKFFKGDELPEFDQVYCIMEISPSPGGNKEADSWRFRESDCFGHWGTDEFVLWLHQKLYTK